MAFEMDLGLTLFSNGLPAPISQSYSPGAAELCRMINLHVDNIHS
jgi:hypothetical protein